MYIEHRRRMLLKIWESPIQSVYGLCSLNGSFSQILPIFILVIFWYCMNRFLFCFAVHNQFHLKFRKESSSKLFIFISINRAHFLIVAGHHPIYSAGTHGNTRCLNEKIKPLLEKYNVTAYFSGHDHNIQVCF